MSRRFPSTVLAVLLAGAGVLGAAGCSALPGQDTGPLELTAVFDDVGNMRPGHLVKVADVEVGSITGIDLADGYRAEVTMSIDDIDLPRDTVAYVRTTSVLGEKFIELRPPLDVPAGTPMLADGDRISEVGIAPEFEDLVFELGGVLSALAGSDLATLIDEANTALNGRAGTFAGLLGDLHAVTRTFAEQSGAVVRTIDALDSLAARSSDDGRDVSELLANLEAATGMLAENRERLVTTLRELTTMAQATNDAVFDEHTEAVTTQVGQLRRLLDEVVDRQDDIRRLLPHLGSFSRNSDKVLQDDFVNDYIISNLEPPGVDREGGGG